MGNEVEKVDPKVQFKVRTEAMSRDFLSTMLEGEEGTKAAGRVALAFRMAALRVPELYSIDPARVGYCIAMCAAMDLLPGGPLADCWLIPRNAKIKGEGGKKDQYVPSLDWQISARGLKKLGERAGWDIRAVPVFVGERFEAPRGLHENIVHEPDYERDLDTYDALRLFYVVAERNGHRPAFRIVTKGQIEKRRASAESDKFWKQWPLEMAEKTAIAFAIRRGLVPTERIELAVRAEEDGPPAIQQAQVVAAPAVSAAAKREAIGGMAGLRKEITDNGDGAGEGGGEGTDLVREGGKPVAAEIRLANIIEQVLGGERFGPVKWSDLRERLLPIEEVDGLRPANQHLDVIMEKAIAWGIRERGWIYNGETGWLTDGVTPAPAKAPAPAADPPSGDKGKATKPPKADPPSDARAMFEACGGLEWKLPVRFPGDVKERTRKQLGRQRLPDEQLYAAMNYGVEHGMFRFEGGNLCPPKSDTLPLALAARLAEVAELEQRVTAKEGGADTLDALRHDLGLDDPPRAVAELDIADLVTYRNALREDVGPVVHGEGGVA